MSTSIREDIQGIFREVFDDPDLELAAQMTAADIDDWDSLSHISLMFTIESHFGISFTDAEMSTLQDVDDLVSSVERHLAAR